MSLARCGALGRVLATSQVRLVSTSVAAPATAQSGQTKMNDPVGQLFLDKIRTYAQKQKSLGKDKLVDATGDTERNMTETLNAVAKQYRIPSMQEAVKFPQVSFEEKSMNMNRWFSGRTTHDVYNVDGSIEHYHIARKVMLLGDSGSGKTCLLIRFKDGTFLDSNFISTVGIDYRVWDTAGQERFRAVTHAYYRDADAAMLVFDLTHRPSFSHVRNWANEVRERAPANICLLLVGNKADAAGAGGRRQVPRGEATAFAADNAMGYVETSAKTGMGVNEAFECLTRCQGGVFGTIYLHTLVFTVTSCEN